MEHVASNRSIDAQLDGYVAKLISSGAIRSAAVETAFRRVPRHRLIEGFYPGKYGDDDLVVVDPDDPAPEHISAIYGEGALVTRVKDGLPASSSSAAGLVASMLDLLEIKPGMRVLEIGAGTGYNAALLSEMVGDQRRVVSVEYQEDVVAQTRRLLARAGYGEIAVIQGDGFFGYQQAAPFDRVVVTVGCPDISPHWLAQLSPQGFALVPLRQLPMNPLVRVWNEADEVQGRVVGLSGFMMMQGELYDSAYWPKGGAPMDTEAAREDPVWADFNWRPQAGEAWEASEWGGFWYFLATRERRAWMPNWRAFGLWEEGRGTVLVTEGTIRTVGDVGLRAELDHLYDDWQRLGRPRPSQYRLAFLPMARVSRDVHPGAWNVDRRFFSQLTWVEEAHGR